MMMSTHLFEELHHHLKTSFCQSLQLEVSLDSFSFEVQESLECNRDRLIKSSCLDSLTAELPQGAKHFS
jgi:hypothetical protein